VVIVATRIMPGANVTDNDTDLCMFNSDLALLQDTPDLADQVYTGVAMGNFTGSSYPQALVVAIEFDDPDNETSDNFTSYQVIFDLVAHDNISQWQDNGSYEVYRTIGTRRTVLYTGDVQAIEYDGDELSEWIVLSNRPKYQHPYFPATPEYPAPEYVHTSNWEMYDMDYDEWLQDNITFEVLQYCATWSTRGGMYTAFDYGMIGTGAAYGFSDVICTKFSDNVYEDHPIYDSHDNYFERGADQDPYWKWDCNDIDHDAWDWDPSTPVCDNDFPGTDVLPYISNLGQWQMITLTQRASLIYNTAYRDIVLADVDGDDDVEALVTAG